MSVYFCQPGKAGNLLAPQPKLVLRRSRCRQDVGKISDTSGFQRRDLELRFRDSQEMSGPHVCTALQGDEVVRAWVCPVFWTLPLRLFHRRYRSPANPQWCT